MKKLMKVLLVLTLALVVVFAFSACGDKEPEVVDSKEAVDQVGESFDTSKDKIEEQIEEKGAGFLVNAGLKITSNQTDLAEITGEELKFDLKATVDSDDNVKFSGEASQGEHKAQISTDGTYIYMYNSDEVANPKVKISIANIEQAIKDTIEENMNMDDITNGDIIMDEETMLQYQQAMLVLNSAVNNFMENLDYSKLFTATTSVVDGVTYYTFATSDNFINVILEQVFAQVNGLIGEMILALETNTLDQNLKCSMIIDAMYASVGNYELTEEQFIEGLKANDFEVLKQAKTEMDTAKTEIETALAKVINKFKISYSVGIKKDIISKLTYDINIDVNNIIYDEEGNEVVNRVTLDVNFYANLEVKKLSEVEVDIPTDTSAYIEIEA